MIILCISRWCTLTIFNNNISPLLLAIGGSCIDADKSSKTNRYPFPLYLPLETGLGFTGFVKVQQVFMAIQVPQTISSSKLDCPTTKYSISDFLLLITLPFPPESVLTWFPVYYLFYSTFLVQWGIPQVFLGLWWCNPQTQISLNSKKRQEL